jgi:hypothetical protein
LRHKNKESGAVVLKLKVVGKSERDYQREIISQFPGWAEGFHPALGSNTGIPDTMFLWKGSLVPIELKIGEIVEGVLNVRKIRPSQIRWAKKFANNGGKSSFVCGVIIDDSWNSFMLPLDKVFLAEKSFDLSECRHIKSYQQMLLATEAG